MSAAALDHAADTRPGFIAGIASTPSVDAYGHKVLAHAFDASIRKKGLSGPQGVKLLAHHDWKQPAGRIIRLDTVGENLRIEAELNLDVGYVRDLHSTILHNGGLSFSVGFALDEYDLIDDAEPGEPWMVIKSGDLMEVSIVLFPACLDATMEMSLAKSMPVDASFDAIKARIASAQLTIASILRNAHG